MAHSWLTKAMAAVEKPKESVIGVLKKNIGGYKEGRKRTQLHASDITKPDFCPRREALHDIKGTKSHGGYLPTALATTFDLGNAIAKLLIEDWAGDSVVGNWECLRCGDQRTLSIKPKGTCDGKKDHLWSYKEVMFEDTTHGYTGSIDAIFLLGSQYWMVVELKIMAPTEFDGLMAPLPEHRIRTSLYMKLIEESTSVWKSKFNLKEARVVYVSRGYGKQNAIWNEVLPFKEFTVLRDDSVTKKPLQMAKALKIFREKKLIPNGICSVATDKTAQKCDVCKECFSGEYVAQQKWEDL